GENYRASLQSGYARRGVHWKVSSDHQWKRLYARTTATGRTVLMRDRVIASITALLLAMTIFSPAALAQAGQRGGGGRGNAAPPSPPHDPHDLSGVWLQRGGGTGSNPISEWTKEQLPFTPKGKAEFDGRKPGKGPRAGLPAKGNDPLGDANV